MARGPWKNNKDMFRLGNALGVDSSKFQEEDTGSQGAFDSKGYQQAIEDAYANDYDIRRGLEAAHLSGKFTDEDGNPTKDAPPRSIGDWDDVYAADKFFNDTHREMGNGGKFSSNQDYANVTEYYTNKDRDELLKKIIEKEQDDTFLSSSSDEVKAPYQATEFWENLVEDPNFERYEEVPADRGYTPDDSAVSFKNKYMTDLTEGLNIQGRQTLNLRNAMNAVGTAETKQGHNNYMAKFKDDDDD